MAEEFTAKFKVDISDLKQNIAEATKEIKLADATFKAQTAGMDKWTKSADGLSKKIDTLKKNLESQKKILESYKGQLKRQQEAYDENGKRVEALRNKLKELADSGVSKTSEEYKKYEKALKDTIKEQDANGKAVDDLKLKVLEQEAAVGETERGIRHYEGALEDLGKEEEDVVDKTDDASSGFTVFKGVLADLVSSGIKMAIDALKDLGQAAVDAYLEFDEGADNIIKKTGATGEAAEELQEAYKNVAMTVVGDLGDIGDAIGEVNTRFGLTGEDLEDLTTKFLKFAELNDTDVTSSIDSVQAAMEAFGVETDSAGDVLDILNKAAQDTGVPMDKLTDSLLSNATALQEMGFGINTATGFLASLEKNGIDSSSVMAGMKKALQNATKEGKPLSEALDDLQKKMAGAKDDTEAMQIASELFGNKAGPAIAKAVQEGRLSFDELSNSVGDFTDSVDDTYDSIKGVEDGFTLAGQALKVQVGETIAQFLEDNGPAIKAFLDTLTNVVIPALVLVLGTLLTQVTNVVTFFFNGWQSIKSAWEAAPAFFKNLWEQIKNAFSQVKTWLAETFGQAWEAIKAKFSGWVDFWQGLWNRIKSSFSKLGTSIANAISGSVKTGINGVIRTIEGTINKAVGIINGAIDLINKVPGVSAGHVPTVHLPRLSRGGVLRKGEVGILEGTGAEAVVPLDKNKQWVHAVARDMAQEMYGPGTVGGSVRNMSRSYTQIINAPKAPSRIELYRQTKNLLALAEGGVV